MALAVLLLKDAPNKYGRGPLGGAYGILD
jgi:hypothetical protein